MKKVLITLCSYLLISNAYSSISAKLVNAKLAKSSQWKEVIRLQTPVNKTTTSSCTATIVGPQAIITAAHCVEENVTSYFELDGKKYYVKFRISQYYDIGFWSDEGKMHDLAMGIINKEVTGIDYASISPNTVTKGMEVHLLGYGMYNYKGDSDKKLREGDNEVTDFLGDFFEIHKKGAAITYSGDSGGPAFDLSNGKHELVGIHSRGISSIDTAYETRLDVTISQDFIKKFASDKGIDVCGVTTSC